MTDLLDGEYCAFCGSALRIVRETVNTTSVRCTHCPAGGDILDDKTTGPAFNGAIGAQKRALECTTPDRDTTRGETA